MSTIKDFADQVTANAKTNKWFNATTQVTHNGVTHGVGCKAFGKCVQIIEVCGIRDSVYECKTNKAFHAAIVATLENMFKSIGA